MKSKTPYLDLYMKWMREGEMPTWGLCGSLGFTGLYGDLDIFEPTKEDYDRIGEEDKNIIFWGSDSPDIEKHIFTPLRQNIVLLMAAMNGELK
jgi:hypothetical protein